VLLILDVYPLRRLGGASGWWGPAARRVYAEKVPFGLLALAASAMAFRALGDVAPQLDPAGKVAVSAWSLVFYLRKTVLPLGLSPLYPMPRQVLPLSAPFLLAGGAVLLAAGACWALRRRWPAVPAAMLAFGVILLPVLGIHQNGPQIAADRYTYLAGGAVALLAGAAVRAGRARFGGVADGVALLAVLALGLLTWRQAGVWRDSGSLWSQAVAVAPESSIARNNWGNVLAARGRLAEAAAEYREALRLDPEYAEAHNDLGVVLARTGDPAGAIAQYRQALAFRPRYGEAEGNWGVALSLQGDLAGAIERYRRAIAINPEDPEPEVNWGNALVRQGQFEEAMAHYARALEVAPGNASAHHNWGVALVQAGRVADAIGHFRQAVALDPGERLYQEHLRRAEELLASPRP
jgi:Flp pilus assembly protein TadD